MTRMTAIAAAAALALASGAGSARASEGPAESSPQRLLDHDALTETFTGADLNGCYADHRPWAEYTREDGVLVDRMLDREVGRWWIEGHQVCYAYDDPAFDAWVRGRNHCFYVVQRGPHLDFRSGRFMALNNTTDCNKDYS